MVADTTHFEDITERLPRHLQQFIAPQNYDEYTPINQAVWRYVMRKNITHLKSVAHESYIEGLKKTGIEIDTIPSIYGMNRILKEIGWAAVAEMGLSLRMHLWNFRLTKCLLLRLTSDN